LIQNINTLAIEFDAEEAFEQGRHALAQYLPVELSFKNTAHFSDMAKALETDVHKLTAFWFAYFTARLKIEQSYDFLLANECFEWGVKQLETIADQSCLPSNCVILKARVSVRSVDADRGIHNNDFMSTQAICEELLQLIESNPDCQESLIHERFYLQGILALSQPLVKRMQGNQVQASEWEAVEQTLQTAYLKVRAFKIYASTLKAHKVSIRYLKQVTHSPLRVEEGRLISSYYATVNSIEVDDFIDAIKDDALRQQLMTHLNASQFYEPEPPDILSDLSENGQFHVWQFDLSEVLFPQFRTGKLVYGVSLRFNSLGLIQLHFETDLKGQDVNDIRHLINLPLENALDEEIVWQSQTQWQYLRHIAAEVFKQVNDWLGEGQQLIYNTSEQVSTTLLLETMITQASPDDFLSCQEVQAHPDWQGIMLPPREVRSTFENWRVQTPHKGIENIASSLYPAHNWIQTDGSYAVIMQLDQPNWVTEQALENVQVATGARFYMQQLGKMLFKNVRKIQQDYQNDAGIEGRTRAQLQQQEKIYRHQLEQLNLLNFEVKDLLHLMDTGGLMRFPDHGRFIQKLFSEVGVNQERVSLQSLIEESQESTRILTLQISNALNELGEKSRQRFDAVIGFIGLLLSVSALKDLFDIMQRAGVSLSGNIELDIVLGLMLMILIYFSLENIIRRFK